MNRLVDPNDEATTLDCDTNTVYCVRVKARSSELDKIDMLMNIWGNFESGLFTEYEMPCGDLLYSVLYSCTEIYANPVKIIPQSEYEPFIFRFIDAQLIYDSIYVSDDEFEDVYENNIVLINDGIYVSDDNETEDV